MIIKQKFMRHTISLSETFSLPQNIRIMASNYQPFQTIFAISESECHTELKTEEQFSPTVSIASTATRQTLNCVLLLHGEKPPEVNHRTLFCYIAVQVTAAQYHDALSSHPYTLYHIESKPCKQGKLPLIFCFHQPGMVCIIQLSVHSIVDSEGVEYMHYSEDCMCIVRIIDRKQHHCHSRTQHEDCTCVVQVREVMSRDPPLLRCTGPLTTKKYHSIAQRFEEWSSSSSYEQIKSLAKHIVDDRSMKLDYKCFALCWEASTELFTSRNYEDAEYLLKTALEKVSQPECENSFLLEGMVHRVFATMFYNTGKYVTALKHISAAKDKLFWTFPPKEKALVLYREAVVKLQLLGKQMDSSAEKVREYKSIESCYDPILDHAKFMEHYEKQYFLLLLTEKAKYHLRTLLISDKRPSKEYWPTPHDLWMAKECLDGLALDMFQRDRFAANYCCARCDLCLWKKEYPEAIAHACQANTFYAREKNERVATRRPNKRLQLLKKLIAQCI